MSLRQRTRRILHNSWLLLEILPLPYLSSSHGKCTSAREAGEISSLRVPETLPHSLLTQLKNYKPFCKLCCYAWPCCAASLLLLWAVSLISRDEDNLVRASVSFFPSPWTHEALQVGISLTVVISSPITSFLPLLPAQPHHYWKLRLYSSSLRICLHHL